MSALLISRHLLQCTLTLVVYQWQVGIFCKYNVLLGNLPLSLRISEVKRELYIEIAEWSGNGEKMTTMLRTTFLNRIYVNIYTYIRIWPQIWLQFVPKGPVCNRLPSYHPNHWPLARYDKLWVAHAPGMPGTFSPPPRVSHPDMHHGTCVTHVSWCMPGSLTSGFLWSRVAGKTFPAFPAHA